MKNIWEGYLLEVELEQCKAARASVHVVIVLKSIAYAKHLSAEATLYELYARTRRSRSSS